MTYDEWKTRDDLMDEWPDDEDDEPSELEEVYGLLHDAQEERDSYRNIANGLYGLLVLISNRSDVSDELRDIIANNHRTVDAGNTLQPETRLEWPKF